MKKYLYLFAVSTIVWACANKDQKATGSTQQNRDSLNQVSVNDSTNFTSLQWIDSTFQDLGKVNEGQMVDITWRLKNTGSKPLVIANVSPGCGCTVAEKPTEPIAPGMESTIKAKFDSKNQSEGEHRKTINVRANTNENTYILSFKVDVKK